jgi:hypothetical protein
MTLPAPFAYPSRPHQRRHGPSGYDDYGAYKPWLRDEFLFRCVYCLEREMWYPDRAASFSVDHIVPQSQDAALVCVYTNLTYACTRCNSGRQDTEVLNPNVSTFADHMRLGDRGLLIGVTDEGKDLIDLLHLNEPPALDVRRQHLRIIALAQRYPADEEARAQFREAFGFPVDLPDLRAKRPPSGNSVAGSERTCWFAVRERGELPETY